MIKNFEEIQSYFKENKYVVIKDFLNKDTALLLYNYCKIKAQSINIKKFYCKTLFDDSWDGSFSDKQSLNDYSYYGDPIMESILLLSLNSMQNFTGLNLACNYSYWRLYQKNSILKKHIDRKSCEISTTLCLGYDISDVDQNVYPDFDWPMFVKDKNNNDLPIHLKPGDMLIYRGCEVEHWREPFIGVNHAQVFLHYNDTNNDDVIINDNRVCLGVPKKFISERLTNPDDWFSKNTI
jgi:hypothetical protein